jgi:hypothetical protein
MCVGSLVEVGLLQFSHKSFPDWLEQNEKFHEVLLCSVCLKVVSDEGGGGDGGGGGSGGTSVTRSYSLKHVVSHLVESGRKDGKEKAKKLLLNVGIFNGKRKRWCWIDERLSKNEG